MIFKKKTYIPEGFKGDLVESPHDPRDYALSSVSPVIQRYPEVCPRPFDLTISNQGQMPSCVGHSVAGMKQYFELQEKISKDFDGNWLYQECKKIDGIPNIAGTYFRIGLEVARKIGVKPMGEDNPFPYRIETYARVDDNTFEGLKKAIFLYGVVLAGFRGSNQGWASETIRPPREVEAQWGHATFLTHYGKDYLGGQNSWGENAHNKGLFKVPANYLPFEAWVIVRDAVTDLNPQPIKTGWVAVNWIRDFNGTWKTTGRLNVREQAGTSFNIIKTLQANTIIQLTGAPREARNGYVWAQIIL